MSLLFAEHNDAVSHTPQPPFEYLYDKYGPAIYGFISRTVNLDRETAGKMLIEVFSIWYRQKDTDSRSFIQLMKIMITVMNKRGYLPCLPLLRHPNTEPEQLG